jgi:hypothetical protein
MHHRRMSDSCQQDGPSQNCDQHFQPCTQSSRPRQPNQHHDRFGKHAASQAFYIQILDRDSSTILDQPEGQLVLEIIAVVPDSKVGLLKQSDCLASPVRVFLASGHTAQCPSQLCFSFSIPARIGNWVTVRESGEGFKTNSNAHFVVERRRRFRFTFHRETDVPPAAFPLHRGRLNLAIDGTVELDHDLPDTLDNENVAIELDAVTAAWKCDAIETATRFGSRISSSLTSLHSKKERLKRLVYTAKDILAARDVGKSKVAFCANSLPTGSLGHRNSAAHGASKHLGALAKPRCTDGLPQRHMKQFCLEGRRESPIFKSLTPVSSASLCISPPLPRKQCQHFESSSS